MGSNDVTGTQRFAAALFAPLPRRYERLAEALSFGQNARWRGVMLTRALERDPRLVLDVACGTAAVSRRIAALSAARVVGIDLSEPMLRQGCAYVAADRLGSRIALVAGQAERLPFPDRTFDALTFTYLLRYVEDPAATLRELARVLAPGASAASVEFFVPPTSFWRGWWWLYTRLLLPVAGWALGGAAWHRVGRFLGPSITGHYRRYPLESTAAAWRRAGFEHVDARVMSLGGGLVMWGRRTADGGSGGRRA